MPAPVENYSCASTRRARKSLRNKSPRARAFCNCWFFTVLCMLTVTQACRRIHFRRTLSWHWPALIERLVIMDNQKSRFSPNFYGCEPVGSGKGMIDTVNCIDIGILFLCICMGRFFWACSRYVDKARPARDINIGLQVPTVHGLLNLGISGKNGPNAKDHRTTSKSDGHKH